MKNYLPRCHLSPAYKLTDHIRDFSKILNMISTTFQYLALLSLQAQYPIPKQHHYKHLSLVERTGRG